MKFVKIVLLVNGIVDVLMGLSMVFMPRIMAALMAFPMMGVSAYYFAGNVCLHR